MPGVRVRFADRAAAGRALATELEHLRGRDLVVLGLPRGGVPVAAEVADALDAPLDVIVVRKVGVPSRPELAMGAVGEGGVQVLDRSIVAAAGVRQRRLAAAVRREQEVVERRVAAVRAVRPRESIAGRHVVIVDDGIATGATARAACEVARAAGAAHVTLAVPVAPPEALTELAPDPADEVVAVAIPSDFVAVGRWYEDFRATTDEEVLDCLRKSLSGGLSEPS